MLWSFLKKNFSSIVSSKGFMNFIKPVIMKYIVDITNETDESKAYTKIENNEELFNQLREKLISLESLKYSYEDLKNARDRDIFLLKNFGKNTRPNILITFSCIFLIFLLIIIAFTTNPNIINMCSFLIGIISSNITQIYNFEFGKN